MIKERARNKAFSKIKTKKLEIKKLKHDIKRGNTGVVTLDHLQLCLKVAEKELTTCLLYTSPSPRDRTRSRMPSSA